MMSGESAQHLLAICGSHRARLATKALWPACTHAVAHLVDQLRHALQLGNSGSLAVFLFRFLHIVDVSAVQCCGGIMQSRFCTFLLIYKFSFFCTFLLSFLPPFRSAARLADAAGWG